MEIEGENHLQTFKQCVVSLIMILSTHPLVLSVGSEEQNYIEQSSDYEPQWITRSKTLEDQQRPLHNIRIYGEGQIIYQPHVLWTTGCTRFNMKLTSRYRIRIEAVTTLLGKKDKFSIMIAAGCFKEIPKPAEVNEE